MVVALNPLIVAHFGSGLENEGFGLRIDGRVVCQGARDSCLGQLELFGDGLLVNAGHWEKVGQGLGRCNKILHKYAIN